MTGNPVKMRLAEGGHAIGTWILTIRTPAVVKMAAAAGFDFVFIDMEHSSFGWEAVGDMCELARASGIVPIVRPHEASGPLANRVQDVGAMGVMFPDVTTASEAAAICSWVMYPPDGTRGHTSSGPSFDYMLTKDAAAKEAANEDTMVIIQVESREGVEHIDEILDAGPVDVVEIGAGDLSTSLGVPFETRHPSVMEAVEAVIDSCRRHRVAPGMNCSSPEDAEDLIRRGVRCLSWSTDRTLLMGAYRDAVASLRRAIGT